MHCEYYAMYNYYLECNDTALNSTKHKYTLTEFSGGKESQNIIQNDYNILLY